MEHEMSESDVGVVLAHGGWADGSSWSKVIAGLRSERVKAVAAPLPLTSLADDVAALDQALERVEGPAAGRHSAAARSGLHRRPGAASGLEGPA
jgi:hypothetical protein